MTGELLVVFDTPSIKQFIFGTDLPREVRGAIALLDHWYAYKCTSRNCRGTFYSTISIPGLLVVRPIMNSTAGRKSKMTRHIPECPEPPLNRDPWHGLERLDYEITLVTPMFGGGVEAGKIDPVTLIRGPSIRGQLRFWWRAIRGARFTEATDLRRHEIEVWGDTEHPSRIVAEVKILHHGKTEPWADLLPGKSIRRPRRNYPAYVLFPFQDERGIGKGIQDARFRLRLTFPPSLEGDVMASVWAWINFGGIGARTRRGCGTLWCQKMSPPDADKASVGKWLKENHAKHCATKPDISAVWPQLGRCWIGPRVASPLEAWNDVIKLLRDFRQDVNTGRNAGTEHNRPGRSRWPEAESIRSATGCRSRRHSPAPQIPKQAFPRAEFGMPVIFHFKDSPRKGSPVPSRETAGFDPPDTELLPVVVGNQKSRMASPVILKSLATNSDRAYPLIVLLNAPRLSEVELIYPGGISIRRFGEESIRRAAFAAYPNSPMGARRAGMMARSGNGSAVEAFLAYAGENGYTEVEI